MAVKLTRWRLVASFAGLLACSGSAGADEYTAERVLALQPVQRDVDIDRPDKAETAKCTLTLSPNKRDYIVRDPNGQLLRRFSDTDGDGTIDLFSYFKDGVEVYRDIDSNQDKKADQYRWLNTAGVRWGLDPQQDGKVKEWRAISAEEVTAEAVAALRDRDPKRFQILLLTPKELKSLGLSAAKTEAIGKRVDASISSFNALANQRTITPDTKWVSFGGTQPGIVPAGTEDSTADVTVYENVAAMIETGGKAKALNIGCLVKVGNLWRLVDAPQLVDEKGGDMDNRFVFIQQERGGGPAAQIGQPSEKLRELIEVLQKLPDTEFAKRAELLETLAKEADTPEMRAQWYKQVADTLSAAVQTHNYAQGISKLKALEERLKADPKDADLAFYAQFRWMTAEHSKELASGTNFPAIHAKWVGDLQNFVNAAPQGPDSADAIFELAIAEEVSGNEQQAIKWYDSIIKQYPSAPVHPKAAGAKLRLTSIGRSVPLSGKTIDNKPFDIATNGKGKVVLIQYWATWSDASKSDMPLLRELKNKYAANFEVVGICLDSDKALMTAYLKENPTKWPQLFEDGGFDSRYANQLGIQTLPTMILLDTKGHVVNRNITARELEPELKKLISAK